MGQYWKAVNLKKKEYVHPHKLGSGLKLWEMLANSPGVGAALVILTAAQRERRGGGDLDLAENWHGPERTFPEHNISPGRMPEVYPEIAQRTIGRWAGDPIAIVGDYAEDDDLPEEYMASTLYERCGNDPRYTDISADVAAVIEHELNGVYSGTGWRNWCPEWDDEAKPHREHESTLVAVRAVVTTMAGESAEAQVAAIQSVLDQEEVTL